MEWIKWNIYPTDSSKSNPIWVYSKKYNSITLGYYLDGVYTKGYYDMDGVGITCSFWTKLQPPKPPKN